MTSHVGGIFWAMYYGEENYSYVCVHLGGWGGIDFSDVLRYNPDTDEWEKIGDLDTPRHDHGASAVKWDFVAPFCN